MKLFTRCILAAFFVLTGHHLAAQTIMTIAGTGTTGFSGDGGAASAAMLRFPIGVLAGSSGEVYVLDQWNNRLRLINSSGIITTVAGNGTTGWASSGIAATAVGIDHPRSLCSDVSGNIFIGDEGNQRVRKVTPSGIIHNAAGNGTGAYTGDGGPATDASIHDALGVCTDVAGNLYIADNWNSVVRKVTPAGIISTFAGSGVTGTGGDGGAASAAEFMSPVGLCFDASGNMYIADRHRIRKISTSGIVSTIAGNTSPGYSGDGGPATAAMMKEAMGICIDASGNLYIAEHGNSVIRKVTPAGIISTYAGTGTAAFGGDNGPASAAKLYEPTGVHMDAGGNLYIADYGNQRIRKVVPYNVGMSNASNPAIAINIYPNPTSAMLIIECSQPVNVRVMNLDGTILISENGARQIDISRLAPGNYLLHASDPATGAALYDKVVTKSKGVMSY